MLKKDGQKKPKPRPSQGTPKEQKMSEETPDLFEPDIKCVDGAWYVMYTRPEDGLQWGVGPFQTQEDAEEYAHK